MQANRGRWHVVTDSEFPHEQEGLEHARAMLPDRAPFHAWTNFEFHDSRGRWWEVDLLVLGEGRLHLVELKHYQGRIAGDAYTWRRSNRAEESPVRLARRKAQYLASVLQDAAKRIGLTERIPYVQQAVFLHAANTQVELAEADKADLFGRSGTEHSSGLPSLERRMLESPQPGKAMMSEADLLRVVQEAGFAQRREREVGSWRLTGPAIAGGEEWQDWPAEHRVTRKVATIRFFTTAPGASQAAIGAARKLAEREYALTSRLQHDGILSPRDIVEDDLGNGLVFEVEPEAERLDLWLAENGHTLDLAAQIALIRRLAEAVHFAHSRGVVHRGLSPKAVTIRHEGLDLVSRIGDWRVAGVAGDAASVDTDHVATRIMAIQEPRKRREERVHDAYVAPEGQWSLTANRAKLDVFALGALAYLLVTGKDPATSSVELNQRLEREGGLDLAADLPQVPKSLRSLVLAASTPVVTDRIDSNEFLKLLAGVEAELGDDGAETIDDPLDAKPGTRLGERFEMVRRLGSGSTAVGVLVKDHAADGELRVLKIAKDDLAAARLDDEAAVLSALTTKKAARVVRLFEPEPLAVGNRRALLLQFAGDQTLGDVLRDRRRLSLDLLVRWGGDLLEALVALDAAGVDHRDIKPANLGVRKQPSDRAEHLVLFDFSLVRASASSITAGTPPYLDPFLGTGARQSWDSAAERYAAAVTLFEMATGRTPEYGDGETQPQFAGKLKADPALFDPTVADAMVGFFERALDKDATKRFGTADEMGAAWRATIAATTSTVPEDGDPAAERATLETDLRESGLTSRALSALERFGLATVGDLVAMDASRLSRFVGIVDATKREIRGRAKQWKDKFGKPTQPAASTEGSDSPFTNPEPVARCLLEAVGSKRAPARRAAASLLLGLEGEVPAFATLAELAGPLGLAGAPQVSNALVSVRQHWIDDDESLALLAELAERVITVLEGLDGAAWTDTVVDALARADADAHDRRLVAGLVRAALDYVDEHARGADEESPVARRRRRRDNRLLLGRSAAIAEKAGPLGLRAEELVRETVEAGESVVGRGRSVPALRQIWAGDVPALDDVRLIRLAARMGEQVAASNNGELYSTRMPIVDAVAFALGSTTASQRYTPEDIRRLVRVRFPGVARVPARPGLDRILEEAGTGLVWDGDAYVVPSAHSDSTFGSHVTRLTIMAPPEKLRRHPAFRDLEQSISVRSFLALGVPNRRAVQVAGMLKASYAAAEVNVTDVLLDSLRASAERYGVQWDTVLAADAAGPGSADAKGLETFVSEAIPRIDSEIAAALDAAAAGTRPVLLTEAAPLARYGHMDVLARLADIGRPRPQAVWLIVPRTIPSGGLLDQTPIPLSYASQLLGLEDAIKASEGIA